jgi:UDP-N-acetylmuramoyl-L-alanyl-D-glutamate--2,6-diaminopimelate ligase
MKLKRLLENIEGIEVKGSKEVEITGLSSHSKSVAPGNLFIPKKGLHHDGTAFIPDAIQAGAAAVVTDLYDPFLPVTQVICSDFAKIEAVLADRYYQSPAQRLKMIGVTGTNGKSTCSYLIKHLFDTVGEPTGLIGTIEWVVGDHRFAASMTTPDLITNQKLLREMVSAGCRVACLEVTSHALDQGRVEGIPFDIVLFTHLTPEHLDYHGTFDNYRAAKQKLFTRQREKDFAVMNSDDPTRFETKAKVFTYGIEKNADLMAKEIKLSEKGIRCTVTYKGQEVECRYPLIGAFNVYNLLGTIGVGICAGLSLEACTAALKSFKQVPGRMQKVKNSLNLNVFVDFAHTEDALLNVLQTLKGITRGKIITVFGCGGDRDKSKRAPMGRVVADYSDYAILTNDNPRTEDPQKIAEEILKGFPSNYPVEVLLNRKEAIQRALHRATEHDIVLIAGRGHEKEQIFAHQVLPFDDVEVVRSLCEEKVSG